MKTIKTLTTACLSLMILLSACSKMTKTQKGAAIGTAGGAVIGGIIGKTAGNTAMGAIIGATVGGVTGAIIGKQMDKQAQEIEKQVPGAKVERVGEGIVVEFNDKILFGYDRSDLSTAAQSSLNKLVTVLEKYPDTDLEIQGHTDSKGTDDYNMALSNRRAGAVSSYITSRGIASARVTTKGFGETAPKYSNDTEEGRSQNRRVEFLITANEKMKADAQKQANTQ
jgi:outer membrane protein OmpA-like peptidoglycan-associated protein